MLSADPPGGNLPYHGDVRDFLRSVWAEPRASDPPRRVWRDWALVGVLIPTAVLEWALRPDLQWRTVWMIACVALVPSLLWRRTAPFTTVAVVFGVVTVLDVARLATGNDPLEYYTMVWVLLLCYSLARWGSGREILLGLPFMLVPALISAVFDYTGLAELIGGFALFVAILAIGAAVRYRGRARARELEQVKLSERAELARDLHDTVAHHVSAIAIRAQAGLAASSVDHRTVHGAGDPAAGLAVATDALRVIEAEASRALAEMRSMVRSLRSDEAADYAPNPRITDIEDLARATGGGPRVAVEIVGETDDIPSSVSTAIYRLAQESVTNARRHARHATRIDVGVVADDTSVTLRVRDDGENLHGKGIATPGYGVLGMIERAGLLGGHCEAGPDRERGWTVTAVLPRNGSTA
jgi:signal transduction histidine kinase